MNFFFVIKTLVLLFFFNTQINSQISNSSKNALAYSEKAEGFSNLRKIDSAIVYFKKASDIYVKQNNLNKIAYCYNKIASCFRERTFLDSSFYYIKKSSKLYKHNSDISISEKIKTTENIGWYFLNKKEHSKAIKKFEEVLEKRLKHIPKKINQIANSYYNLGRTYSSLADYDKALEYYKKALGSSTKQEQKKFDNSSLYYNKIGVIYLYKTEYNTALNYFKKALNFQTKISSDDHANNVMNYNNIAGALTALGETKEALKHYEKALEIQITNFDKNDGFTGTLYGNISNCYMFIGNLVKALEYQKKAIKIKESFYKTPHFTMAYSYMTLGSIYKKRNEYEKALENHKKGVAIFKKIFKKDHPLIARSSGSISEVYFAKGDLEKALPYFQKALDLHILNYGQDHPEVGLLYNNLANCYLNKGIFDLAINYSQKAIEIRTKTLGNFHPDLSDSYNIMALAQESMDSIENALLFSKKALESNNKSKQKVTNINSFLNDDVAITTLGIQANLYRKKYVKDFKEENIRKSINFYNRLDTLIYSIRQTKKSYEEKIAFAKTVKKIYSDAIQTNFYLHQKNKNNQKNLIQTIYYSEKSKANTLYELLNTEKAINFAGLPSEIIELENSLKIDFAYNTSLMTEELSNQKIDSVKVTSYENKLFSLRRVQDSLQQILEEKYPKYYNLKYNHSFLSVTEIQQQLSKNTSLLEFFAADSTIYAFTVTKNDLHITKIPTHKLQSSIKQFRKTIVSKNIHQYKEIGHELYKTIIAPVIDKIQGDELIIVPDGSLWHLNFDLLLTQDITSNDPKKFPYLLRDYAITYANSANVLFNTPKRHIPKKLQQCLAFSFSDSLQTINSSNVSLATLRNTTDDLPGTRKEIKAISEIIDGQYYYGNQAIESNFKKNAGHYNILHLALHGELDNEHPENSKLYFTKSKDTLEDNLLYNHEIFAMNIPADLTVLSACNTGSGKIAKGEGIMSIGNAFQYAGTKSLLLSYWNVSDQTTPKLMKNLYFNLKQGMNKGKALQQAKLTYLNNSKITYSHPFFWGGFYILGDTSPVRLSTNQHYWTYALLTIMVAVLSFYLFFYYRKNKVN